jgi:hypothetical protein
MDGKRGKPSTLIMGPNLVGTLSDAQQSHQYGWPSLPFFIFISVNFNLQKNDTKLNAKYEK